MTVHQLMSDTSGLIDDNDMASSPAAHQQALATVKDAKLLAELVDIVAQAEWGAPAVKPV